MAFQSFIFWIFTITQMLVWLYIVSCFSRDVFFNLYVNRARTLLFKPVTWIQSILPGFPEWAAALLLFLFVLMLHPAVARASANPMFFSIGPLALRANLRTLSGAFGFSLFAFAIMIGQINFVRLGMALRLGRRDRNGALECLDTLCWPLSIPRPQVSAAATVGVLVISVAGIRLAAGTLAPHALLNATTAPMLTRLTLFAVIDVLVLLRVGIVGLVILSIGGMLTGRLAVMGMANEWLSSLSRIFIRQPLTFGMLDLTPLLIYFGANFLHGVLITLVAGGH